MTDPAGTKPLPAHLVAQFAAEFGATGLRIFFAPGRVNLVGAHLDYNGGRVLPTAVDRGVYVAARLRDDDSIRLRSLDSQLAFDFTADAVGDLARPERDWANYPLGVWREFVTHTGCPGGFEMVFGGDLPMASGLASSAALEVVTAIALDALHATRLERIELAMMAFRAETRFVGLRCGIMDQFASALGARGMVMLLDCASAGFQYVPIDPGRVEILVMNTGVSRALAGSSFNTRVQECAAAHAALRGVRDRQHLAQYTRGDLAIGAGLLTTVQRMRVEHVVAEMERVTAAVAGLQEGNLGALGRALNESHRSSRELYEISCVELDVITESARQRPAVFGARLTGAGFGGCAVALVSPGAVGEVEAHVAARYRAAFGRDPTFYRLRGGAEPGEISD
jgi:galactokinase